MPGKAPPTPQQLLQQPARFMHGTALAPATTTTQLVDHILAADNRTKRRLISTLIQSADSDIVNRTATAAHKNINKQLDALRWNRLPDSALSHVFSYLTTAQTIQLRRTCVMWNKVGKLATSFNSSVRYDLILQVDGPVDWNLAGVKAVKISINSDTVREWDSETDTNWMAQHVYTDILESIVDNPNPAIDTLVSHQT